MSEEGAFPEVLGEFEIDSPDFGWWDTETGSTEGRRIDMADSEIHLFDVNSLTPEKILLIEKWSRELQSGKYAQGKEYLFQIMEDEVACYCCLAIPFLDEEWHEANEDGKRVFGLENYVDNSDDANTCNPLSLPTAYYKRLALIDSCGAFRSTGPRRMMPISLAQLNDELGWNFKKIGKLITIKLLQAEDRERNAVQISEAT